MQNARFALLIVTLFFIQLTGYSQSRQRWSFGPRVNLNLTNFAGPDADTYGTGELPSNASSVETNRLLPGIEAGVGFMYSDISRFGFAFDVLYSQRGNQTAATTNNTEFTRNTRLNYLSVPITARYFLNRSGNFRPNVYAGIVPAVLLSTKQVDKPANSTNTGNVNDRFKKGDLGLTAGFQANFRTGDRQRFTVDARYTYGVPNISEFTSNLHNQMITVGLGYNFGIGRQYQPGDRKLPIRNR
ncbi:porin family protein [Fibrella aquatica]|uniref:porin family protein n=1 Tax=Fibrella aquatica TaxID=3242487 RepID=UPI003521CBF0